MSNAELDYLRETKQQLSIAQDISTRLKKRLGTVEAMYRERMSDIDDLVKALELIASEGGKKIFNAEDGLTTHHDGNWCSDQAHAALDKFRAKPVEAFTLV